MKKIIFALPGNEEFAELLSRQFQAEIGTVEIRQFPDGESYVRIDSDVKGLEVILVCTLHDPDSVFMPMYFLAKTAKDLGASRVHLVAPYLGYMRQDIRFKPGEGITSAYFAQLVCEGVDSILTVDPHLHRYSSLSEIYKIPNTVVHASSLIAQWIKENVDNPVLIGPDSESHQWVAKVAQEAGAPFLVLEKKRLGDEEVKISVPDTSEYSGYTPVLIDDIISTAGTMKKTVELLQPKNLKAPVCIAIHAVFSDDAFDELKAKGTAQIITTNTIPHGSNSIDLSPIVYEGLQKLLAKDE